MSRTYIAGYDGTDAATAAVRFAAAMAAAEQGDVLAVAAFRPAPIVIGKGSVPHVERQMNEDARRACAERLAGIRLDGVETLVATGDSPAHALHDLAADRDAALIAVGRTGRGWMGRAVPGSTAERLVHGAPCPVAAVPAAWPGRLRTVGVAYDDGPEARVALRYAVDLARGLGARLLIVSAFEPVLASYGAAPIPAYDDLNTKLRRSREHALRAVLEEVPEELAAETRLLDGEPGPALAGAAAEADVLVAGSRGFGPVRAVLAGSTSRYLLDHAPCPVVVVPRGVFTAPEPAGEPVGTAA